MCPNHTDCRIARHPPSFDIALGATHRPRATLNQAQNKRNLALAPHKTREAETRARTTRRTSLTFGVSTMAGSEYVPTDARMRMPTRTKRAGMSTTNAHIFLSRLKVSRRFLSKATICRPKRDLERSMPRSSVLPSPATYCFTFRVQI